MAASAATLTITHGTFDDWGMRATLPLWLVLAATAVRLFFMPIGFRMRAAILAVLIGSSADSLSEIGLAVFMERNCAPYGSFEIDEMGPLAVQYQGRADSLLYRHFVGDH